MNHTACRQALVLPPLLLIAVKERNEASLVPLPDFQVDMRTLISALTIQEGRRPVKRYRPFCRVTPVSLLSDCGVIDCKRLGWSYMRLHGGARPNPMTISISSL